MAPVVVLFCALASQVDEAPPTITHEEIKVAVRGKPFVVTARIEDPSGVFDPTLLFRVGGEGPYERTPMKSGDDGAFRAEIPSDIVVADLEYFIEAYDEQGNGPATAGDESLPIQVKLVEEKAVAAVPPPPPPGPAAPPPEEEGSILPWALGGTAAGVVALVVVVAVATGIGVGVWYVFFREPPVSSGDVTITVEAGTPVSSGARR